jgi:hypothetical protein
VARVLLIAPGTKDIEYIAAHLRREDVQELQAANGREVDLLRCLHRAVNVSDEAYIAISAAGEPFALLGVSPLSLLGGVGCPWMVGTETMAQYPREVVEEGRRLVGNWSQRYAELYNFVDARNRRSIAWLKRIGFSIPAAQPYGPEGLPFHRFERCT